MFRAIDRTKQSWDMQGVVQQEDDSESPIEDAGGEDCEDDTNEEELY